MTGIDACPAILPGPGKVVLTTFHHASSDLIDLYLSPQPTTGVNSLSSHSTYQTSEESLLYPQASRSTVVDQSWERIGVTGNHPIWSEDRHDYVAAMDLRVGERLKNLSGDTVYVQQKLPRPGPTPVYNLEVQDEHVYYVGASGVLAHNVGDKCGSEHDLGDLSDVTPFPKHFDTLPNTVHRELDFAKKHDLNPDSEPTRRLLLHLDERVADFISAEGRSGILEEFPGELLNATVEEAFSNSTARKLLLRERFKNAKKRGRN